MRCYPLLAGNACIVFVELPIFVRCAADLFSDDDVAELQNTLLENPAAGNLIPGGRGLRKLQFDELLDSVRDMGCHMQSAKTDLLEAWTFIAEENLRAADGVCKT